MVGWIVKAILDGKNSFGETVTYADVMKGIKKFISQQKFDFIKKEVDKTLVSMEKSHLIEKL